MNWSLFRAAPLAVIDRWARAPTHDSIANSVLAIVPNIVTLKSKDFQGLSKSHVVMPILSL